MKQLFLRQPQDLVLREVEPPRPGPGEVTVRMRAALTCGTDLKFFRRGHPKFPLPSGFGHEFAGDVLEVGEGVTAWAPGQPVMLAPTAPCGSCPECQRGLENLCPLTMKVMILGAFAEVVRVPAVVVRTNMFSKPDSLSYQHAALLEPLACVVYGMSLVRVEPWTTVAVLGAGPIGLLYTILARLRGARRVLMVGRHPSRLEAARRLGAEIATQDQLGEADLVVECTGQPEVWEMAVRKVGKGGTVLFYGGCPAGTQVVLPLRRVQEKGLWLQGAFHFTPAAVAEARELLVQTRIPAAELISGEVRLEEYEDAFARLDRGEAVKLAFVNPGCYT